MFSKLLLSMHHPLASLRSKMLAGLLLGCIFLLSICGGLTTAGSSLAFAIHLAHGLAPVVNSVLEQKGLVQEETFLQWIALLRRYHGDTGQYVLEYSQDQKALHAAKNNQTYQAALQDITHHVTEIKMQALQREAITLEQQLQHRVTEWSKQHTFHDSYNDQTYQLGYEYTDNGVGGLLHDEITGAKTLAAYQQAIEDANASLTSFYAYRNNVLDKTSWGKTHRTDLQLITHYRLSREKVIVVSLSEQALRVYDQGALVRAFQVTTGRPDKPSLPGSWVVQEKQSPTIFKSSEPRGSPYWYPDTPISYAMLYHSDGYYIHDSWWRTDYGPGTQFPHMDSSGDSFSFDGSHGCINVATAGAAWLYNYVTLNTHILIY